MLQSLEGIGAYAFRQYADDPNITVWFEAFNSAAQQYLDWFTGQTGEGVSLGYYPGLSGAVLQWMGASLYGVPYFSALASSGTAAVGPFDTAAFNTIPFNAYTAPSESYYAVTDDIYKRIITWNVYKGDGKRFCPRWLKRRIMRFLVGTDGIDPQPWNAGFVVGTENTQAISVQFSGQTCTVSINQLAISALTQLTPNILNIFAAAFMAPGVLEKPIEWTYVVDITTQLTALVSPLSLSVTGASASESTGLATVSVLGGSGSYTYAWEWQSGGTGITIADPTAYQTAFNASSLTPGQTLSGIALCTVTDTVSHDTAKCSVPVSIARVTLPVATPSPTSLSATGSTDTVTTAQVTVTVTGGQGPYSGVWTWDSGGSGIGINSPQTLATTFTATALEPNQEDSGTALCTVTDAYDQQTTCTVPVEISRVTQVTASISPSSLSQTTIDASGTTTDQAAVTASGGLTPYSYAWAWVSGGAGMGFADPSSAATTFTWGSLAPGASYSGTAQCTVKDSLSQQAQVSCNVSVTRPTLVSASVSPDSQSSSGTATSQTTGISTVTASGGSGSYTYSWGWISGGTNLAINSLNSAATSFTGSGMAQGNTYSGTAQCTITDGYGQQTYVSVTVEIECTLPPQSNFSITAGAQSFFVGYEQGGFGSITNPDLNGGAVLYSLVDDTAPAVILEIEGESAAPASDFFTSLVTNGNTFTASSASYTSDGNTATWSWSGSAGFVEGDTYPCTLNY